MTTFERKNAHFSACFGGGNLRQSGDFRENSGMPVGKTCLQAPLCGPEICENQGVSLRIRRREIRARVQIRRIASPHQGEMGQERPENRPISDHQVGAMAAILPLHDIRMGEEEIRQAPLHQVAPLHPTEERQELVRRSHWPFYARSRFGTRCGNLLRCHFGKAGYGSVPRCLGNRETHSCVTIALRHSDHRKNRSRPATASRRIKV